MVNTQTVMTKPPEVLTGKDLTYIEDAMSWELLAMKKCRHYSNLCQDPEVKSLLDEAGRMHQAHYVKLHQHLNPQKVWQ
ncbi:MAG TPA: hypothetical protein GXX57_04380 [Firmicutes bacterium]|jgi:hypothetical protein|nr:hypothetical protein [Bacillota bacterium]